MRLQPAALVAALALAQSAPAQLLPAWSWLKISGEARVRAESPGGLNFIDGATDSYLLTRLRLGVTVTPVEWFRVSAEMHDVAAPGYNAPVPGGSLDRLDLRQAWAEFGKTEGGSVGLRVGRQSLRFGKGRLISDPDWGSAGQTFDAVRLAAALGGVRVDAFAASPVTPLDGVYDRAVHANMFCGLYGNIQRWNRFARVEPYLFLKSNAVAKNERGSTGSLNLFTPGARIYGTLGRADWEAEMAWQRGWMAQAPVEAFAGVWVLGWKTGGQRWQPRVSFNYSYASGDKNSRDGVKNTFDVLYPSVHLRTGAADRIGWSNIHDISLQGDWKPYKKMRLNAGMHEFHLATVADALYNSRGSAVVRNTAATSSRVGLELFAVADYPVHTNVTLSAGYAHLFPGEYLRQSKRGGATQPYISVSYRF